MSANYVEQVMQRSFRVSAVAKHYGIDYGLALVMADAMMERNAGKPENYWHRQATMQAKAALGSAYDGYVGMLREVMRRRLNKA